MIDNMYSDMHAIIAKRASVNDEWQDEVNRCWNEMVDYFSKDIERTNQFIKTDCTADELSWLSEVFEQIARKTHSSSFIDAIKYAADKYPEETETYNIHNFIDAAELIVNNKAGS